MTSTASSSSPTASPYLQYRPVVTSSHTAATRHNTSPRDPTIRHAGRAHIRGKIRRVWRPRYLELCDTGLVRYYELPPTADVTLPEDSDWDHVNMIPKDTLVIYHARIIDVTTLRDLHVGLPKGSFGFLFRGQRQASPLELLPPSGGTDPNPPREYFCAVSTLEEAQTWVIVLQWAASIWKASTIVPHGGEAVVGASSMNFLGDSCTTSKQRMVSPPPPTYDISIPSPRENESVSVNSGSIGAATTTSTADSMGSPTVVITRTPKPKPMGRIVVTKINGYEIARVPSSSLGAWLLLLEWQVAYQVSLLLIQGSLVEERRLLRTPQQLMRLLEELLGEVDSKISLGLIHEWKSKLLQRPLPPTRLDEYGDNAHHQVPRRIMASFTLVDQLLRALAMDANIVNSKALKRCLGLDSSSAKIQVYQPSWWKIPTPRQLEESLTYRQTRNVPEDDMDAFVKQWLSTSSSSSSTKRPLAPNTQQDWKTSTFLWVAQRPWMVLTGAGVGLALSVPLARVYQQVMVVSLSIRLDVLMGSWCLAAYIGKEYFGNGNNHHSSQHQQRGGKLTSRSSVRSGVRTARMASRPPLAASSRNDDLSSDGSKFHHSSSSPVVVTAPPSSDDDEFVDASSVDSKDDDDLDYLEHHEDDDQASVLVSKLSSPLPQYPQNNGESCWSSPPDNSIFRVRGTNYLEDRIKIPSGPSPFICRGVDVWLTDNPERHIARHPAVLNGKLREQDTFLVNFLLPFGNFVSYFTVPPLEQFPDKQLATVWSRFVKGDQQYRDKRLKLLPVVMDGPWIVKAAVGNGTAPALLGKVIPLQYYFQERQSSSDSHSKAVYEVDVIITASSIAKGILSVVKGHTKSLTIAFAFIIEAAEQEELPETVLCAFQVHQLHLEDCPHLPECNLDEI